MRGYIQGACHHLCYSIGKNNTEMDKDGTIDIVMTENNVGGVWVEG